MHGLEGNRDFPLNKDLNVGLHFAVQLKGVETLHTLKMAKLLPFFRLSSLHISYGFATAIVYSLIVFRECG